MTVARRPSDAALNELSAVIGELRNFAAQQAATNTHMLEELKKISERVSALGEVGATFVEYRKALHERFNQIHEQMGEIDLVVDKLQDRFTTIELLATTWKANLKMVIGIVYIVSSLTSALLVQYGSTLIRALGQK